MNRIIEISNAPLSGFKRKVEWTEFCFTPSRKMVTLDVNVYGYKNENGQYGERVDDEYPPFRRVLVASNDRFVNPANNGMVVNITQEEEEVNGELVMVSKFYDAQTNALLQPETLMRQYDFFEYLVENTPVNIPMLIQQTILSDDIIFNTFNKR
jgi:hypothetical protein